MYKAADTTDLTACQGPVSNFGNPYGNWKKSYSSGNGISFDMIFALSSGRVDVRVICKKSGNSVTARASSAMRVTGQTIQFLNDDSDKQSVTADGETLSCEANLSSKMRFQYSFQGSCLALTSNGEKQLLPPAN